ncbi:MAG: 2-keto-4-pentenoate hydratase [Steroidobacteraceae bacterium]
MLSDEECRRCAEDILRAARHREPIQQPTRTFPAMDILDAYRIQDLCVQARIAGGARVVGHKIGLTSRAMQVALQTNEPDSGRILDDAVYRHGAQIRADSFLKPLLEVEVAFIMGENLEGPDVRTEDVMRATQRVVPALEIVDRRTDLPRTLIDTIADNAAFGAIVIGADSRPPKDVDVGWLGATLARNGVIEESGVSAAVMGHPAAAVAWLANRLHGAGAGLEKGQLVLSGAFMRPVNVKAGDSILADYGPLGTLGVSFV